MEITITREDFEDALPVGMSADGNVFDSVRPAMEMYEARLCRSLLGTEGEAALEGQPDGLALISYKHLACLGAFLSVMRQLDLVLTPTGFGVVSNDNVAPASKQRVDALEGQLRTHYCKTLAMTLNLLRGEAWGGTPQARRHIGHVYDEYTFFFETHQGCSATDWKDFRQAIDDADEMLRTKMGDRQMEDILDAFRRADVNRMEPYREVMSLIVKFTDTWAVKGAAALKQPVYRRLMRLLDSEDNKEHFKLYRESIAYKANHYEPYKNTQDSAGFVFNG